jgi:hypothetical protein
MHIFWRLGRWTNKVIEQCARRLVISSAPGSTHSYICLAPRSTSESLQYSRLVPLPPRPILTPRCQRTLKRHSGSKSKAVNEQIHCHLRTPMPLCPSQNPACASPPRVREPVPRNRPAACALARGPSVCNVPTTCPQGRVHRKSDTPSSSLTQAQRCADAMPGRRRSAEMEGEAGRSCHRRLHAT